MALGQWGSRFIRNLFSDGRLPTGDRGFIDGATYQVVREWVNAKGLASPVIAGIKLVHTAIFVVIMSFIVHFAYSGIRNRASRWTLATLGLAVGEGIVLGVNGGRCPLAVVVEDLGSEHSEVADIFLPSWVAQHIAHISTALLGVGFVALGVHRLIHR
jgi:hypothetical protein